MNLLVILNAIYDSIRKLSDMFDSNIFKMHTLNYRLVFVQKYQYLPRGKASEIKTEEKISKQRT